VGAASSAQRSTDVIASDRLMHKRKYPRPSLPPSVVHSVLPSEALVIGVHALPARQVSHRVRCAKAHSATEP
jgi:hypothetical protein